MQCSESPATAATEFLSSDLGSGDPIDSDLCSDDPGSKDGSSNCSGSIGDASGSGGSSDLHFLEVERDLMEDAESDDEKSNSVNTN